MAAHYSPDDLLTAAQVRRWLQVSRSTLDRMVADGRFPAPSVDVGTPRWRWGDLLAWVEVQKLLRSAQVASGKRKTSHPASSD